MLIAPSRVRFVKSGKNGIIRVQLKCRIPSAGFQVINNSDPTLCVSPAFFSGTDLQQFEK